MKYTVMKTFSQALSCREQIRHQIGDEIEVDRNTVESWIIAGFIAENKGQMRPVLDDPVATDAVEPLDELEASDFDAMDKDELVAILVDYGVAFDGRKSKSTLLKIIKELS